ncbi:MAG: hypothetical protein JNL58_32480, partial [Planctomyces sp.]|nr:hypothetical protein [Planctomyces sp.]
VLGLSGIVSKGGLTVSETAMRMDIPIMIATSVSCLPIFFTGHRIARWEGALFLGYYIAYTASLAISATHPELARTLTSVMFFFVIPLTVITLIVGVVRYLRNGTQPK